MRTYLESVKVDSVLLGPVAQHLQREAMADPRAKDVIHPSEMAAKNWCQRATWHRLAEHEIVKPPPLPPLRLSLIFEAGNDIHRKWQRYLHQMGWLYGDWYCVICDTWRRGEDADSLPMYESRAIVGAKPRYHHWRYREVSLEDPTLRIAGKADGIFTVAHDDGRVDPDRLLEVKSIGPGTLRTLGLMSDDDADEMSADKFSRITAPAGSHFRQTQIYMELCHRHPRTPKVEEALVIYEHKADQQVREFPIARDFTYVEHLFETARDIVFALDHGIEVGCPYGGCPNCDVYDNRKE